MLGIGMPEVMMLIVLAVVMFGPEKVPEMSRKAARIVHFLRNVANNAQTQLRSELGPEFADLELSDLRPRTFVQKHLLDSIQSDLDGIKAELTDVKSDLEGELKNAQMMGQDLRHELANSAVPASTVHIPTYADAT